LTLLCPWSFYEWTDLNYPDVNNYGKRYSILLLKNPINGNYKFMNEKVSIGNILNSKLKDT